MLDVNNICRICLREDDPKLPIFSENGEGRPSLPEKIMSFAQVKVTKEDGLSTFICVKCFYQVDVTYDFIKLCEESFQFVTRQLERYEKQHQVQQAVRIENVEHVQTPKEPTLSNGGSPNCKPSPAKTPSKKPVQSRNPPPEELNGDVEVESSLQIASTAGNIPAWSDDSYVVDPSMIKNEPHWDYDSNDEQLSEELDDSNEEEMSYDNGTESETLETSKAQNQAEVTLNDTANSKAGIGNISNGTTSSRDREYRCNRCNLNFTGRKQMGHHISTVHRRCGTCKKYFFTNRAKENHICNNRVEGKVSTLVAKNQFCKICKIKVRYMRQHRSSVKHKENIAELRKVAMRRSLAERRLTKELQEKAEKAAEAQKAKALKESLANESFDTNNGDEKVVCHLCDLVCSNQRGFKTHMTCMHRNYKIVYHCKFCKDRVFFSRINCEKHMIRKHEGVGADNIQFQFKPTKELENVREITSSPEPEMQIKQQPEPQPQQYTRKRRGAVVNKFECTYCGIKYLTFPECQDHLLGAHKSSNAQKIRILREHSDSNDVQSPTRSEAPTPQKVRPSLTPTEKFNGKRTDDDDGSDFDVENVRKPRKTFSAFRKPTGFVRASTSQHRPILPPIQRRKYLKSHPPFSMKMPVVANNFSIVMDDYGVKEYSCNGCESVYNRYISAYNHYYTLSKKFPIVEKKKILADSKPFGCKICTLRFASRAQAAHHRINAHKLFYTQLKAARRNKLMAQARSKVDMETIENRLKRF